MSDESEVHAPGAAPTPPGDAPGADAEERDWVEVRESWVGDRPSEPMHVEPYRAHVPPATPAPAQIAPAPRSVPPPLPPSSPPPGGGTLYEAFALGALRSLDRNSAMLDLLAASDYDGARRVAEELLRTDPANAEAAQCRDLSRSELRKVYLARIGSAAGVPRIVATAAELRGCDVDLRAGLLLAAIDGFRSVDQIVRLGVVDELDALRILSELFLAGAVLIAPR